MAPLLALSLATYLIGANAEYMEGNVNLLMDDGFSFLGHWMFGHNTGNGTADYIEISNLNPCFNFFLGRKSVH